ncbi:MAG: molybdate ABC transporter substrate-binding protein [Gammaproteobacteria bacterium]
MKRFLLLFILSVPAAPAWAETPLVAVASNMTHALKDIVEQYRKAEGKNVKLTFGSSGNFTRQIQQGAPYDVFLSAAESYVAILAEKKLLAGEPRAYVHGRIGFFIPDNSSLRETTNLAELFNRMHYGDYRRIAIANPEHAPYGIAAEQALQNGGVWSISKSKLMIAENAAQVAQYVLSGGVDAGIIPESFTRLPMIRKNGRFLAIPETLHQPITHYLAVLKGSGQAGKDFVTYLYGKNAMSILLKYGYSMAETE